MFQVGFCLDCSLHFGTPVGIDDADLGNFPEPPESWTHETTHYITQAWRRE